MSENGLDDTLLNRRARLKLERVEKGLKLMLPEIAVNLTGGLLCVGAAIGDKDLLVLSE